MRSAGHKIVEVEVRSPNIDDPALERVWHDVWAHDEGTCGSCGDGAHDGPCG